MEDEGQPRKRLQSDPPSTVSRVLELEKELADANKKIAEQGATIRELTIMLEAARREIDDKERIITDKERIISEKHAIISEKQVVIMAQKEASENAANLRILRAEKQFRDRANQKVREKAEEANRILKEKAEEANRILKEKAEEANRLLDDASRRENLLRQDLVQANQRVVQVNRRLDEAYRRENNLMRELSKAQTLHMETKREGKVMFGFLKTGIAAFERFAETKCAIVDRHEDKIPHLKTVGKLLVDESTTPYGVQVAREDPESQHLSGHRYAMIEGTEASINERCATPIGTIIPTVDPDSEYLRFQNTCEDLMGRHALIPSGLVFNLSWYSPYLEWKDASPGNLFEKDVERALRNLSLATEENTVSTLTNSVEALAIAVPQDKLELESETLYPRPKAFWKQWQRVIVVDEPLYVNKRMHPLKLWMHRASMLEYFDSIDHKKKTYVTHEQSLTVQDDVVLCHPTDREMIAKYKKATFIEPLGFLLSVADLEDAPSHCEFYKRMRMKFGILMQGEKPLGDKGSFDAMNRQRYPADYKEKPIDRSYTNPYITIAKAIVALSDHPLLVESMFYPTNRRAALRDLRVFVKQRLDHFGPYQDALQRDVVIGFHSCMSASLNIGLITPKDIIKEVSKHNAPLPSKEGFLRQVVGWREYIRMKYILYGPDKWSYLKDMNVRMGRSWYKATTGIETLDWSITRVLTYGYASHIERLMLLANYAVLMRIRYEDVYAWFLTMFCDAYPWVMLNVSMGVNGLNPERKFMKRAYLTNGNNLKKMGLRLSKGEEQALRTLYDRFLRDHKQLAKRDYMLASAFKQ